MDGAAAAGAAQRHEHTQAAARQAAGVFDTQPTQPHASEQRASQPQPSQPASADAVQRAPVMGSALGVPFIAGTTPFDVDRARHPSGIVPVVQNVVATVNLGCQLELKKIALHARNAEYNPKRFTAVIMRLLEPKTTALIFASGKIVVTGAKSEEAVRLAARKFARIIQKLDFPARFTEFKVQNVVASCDVRFAIRLEGLAANHGHFSSVRAPRLAAARGARMACAPAERASTPAHAPVSA